MTVLFKVTEDALKYTSTDATQFIKVTGLPQEPESVPQFVKDFGQTLETAVNKNTGFANGPRDFVATAINLYKERFGNSVKIKFVDALYAAEIVF